MNKDTMKTAFSYIHEKDDFPDRLSKRMNEERERVSVRPKVTPRARNTRKRAFYSILATASVIVISLAVMQIINMNKGTWFAAPAASEPVQNTNPAAQCITDDMSASSPTIPAGSEKASETKFINYSDLQFAKTEAVVFPSGLTKSTDDILPPYSDLILNCSEAVIKATVTGIHFNTYGPHDQYTTGPNTIVYQVDIEKLYYVQTGLTLNVGDTLTIEDPIHDWTGLDEWTVYPLQLNRQYILPLSYDFGKQGYMESVFSLVYPGIPQIECTEDGGYVFYAWQPYYPFEYYWRTHSWLGWAELINDDTLFVVMDDDEPGESIVPHKGALNYRSDSQFEEEFQSLCDWWCGY